MIKRMQFTFSNPSNTPERPSRHDQTYAIHLQWTVTHLVITHVLGELL